MTRLEKDLIALATMLPAQMAERWAEFDNGAVPTVPPALLRRLLAQRLQEKRYGKLPLLVARELDQAIAREPRAAVPSPKRIAPSIGTRLIREWNGQTVTVEVIERGFSYDGQVYRSLSEIAREVTGAHWSGPRFFGLLRRG